MSTATKVTHTPGPWSMRGTCVYGNGCKVAESPSQATTPGSTTYHPQAVANARLIAAAPDLLSALKLVRPVIAQQTELWIAEALRDRNEETEGKLDGARSFLDELDAAIAKAEGQ